MGATVRIAMVAEGAARVRSEFGEVSDAARRSGREIEQGFNEGVAGLADSTSGIAERLKGGFAAAGLGAGAALAQGISGMIAQEDLSAKLESQLGNTVPAAGDAGKVAGKLYADNFGTDAAQAGEAVKRVYQDIGNTSSVQASIEGISQKVLTLSNTFDQDLGGVTRATGQLMRTGLAANATEALDIITKGLQSGADKAGDFLDTINEYSTQFRKLGIDGQTATGLLSQGLKAGARDADLVADAIKEFSIRSIDGSKTTADGFKALGLNAKTMAEDLAAGGERSSKAFDLTLDRLRGIDDPVKRSAAAVALFGTQAEDLGDALFALDPSSAVSGLGQVGGAAQKVVDTMGGTNAAKIETFKRQLSTGFTEVAGTLAGFATANSQWLVPLVVTLGVVAGAIWAVNAATTAWTAIQAAATTATAAWKAAQLALNASFLANPIVLVIAAIVALVAAIVIAYKNSETFRNIVQAVWSAIQAAVSAVVSWFVTNIPKLWDAAVAVWNAIKTAADAVWNAIKTVVSVVIAAITAYVNAYRTAAVAVWNAISAAASAVWNAIKAVVNAVISGITGQINTFRAAAAAVWSAIQSAASTAWNAIKSVVSTVVSGITQTLTDMKSKVSSAFSNAATLLYNAGRQIVEGLISGIKAMAGRAVDAAKGVVNDAVSGAKRLLGISSPSKVFRGIGQDTGKGLELGLLDSRRGIASAADDLMAIPRAALDDMAVNLVSDATVTGPGASTAPRAVLELRSSGSRVDDLLLEILREAVRARGGDVQVTLGSRSIVR